MDGTIMDSIEFLNNTFKDMDKEVIKQYDKTNFKRNCPNYSYLPTILPPQDRIIAIGDLHGSYKSTINALKIAKVIDNNLNWIGGKTHIVQCGDQIDSCRPNDYKCDHPKATLSDKPDDLNILKFFTDLDKKAIKHGGRVISLLGNHELMNVTGDINYVSYENLKSLKPLRETEMDLFSETSIMSEKEKRKELFEPGNKYGKFLGCTRIPIIVIGDYLFVHGGIVPDFAKMLKIKNKHDLYKLNYAIREWLLGLIDDKSVAYITNGSKNSMFWNRVLGKLPANIDKTNPKCVKYLDPILKIFKIKKMIIGHTPQYFYNNTGINSTCSKRVWRVDIGSSHAFDVFDKKYNKTGVITNLRKVQVLEIKNNSVMKILK